MEMHFQIILSNGLGEGRTAFKRLKGKLRKKPTTRGVAGSPVKKKGRDCVIPRPKTIGG